MVQADGKPTEHILHPAPEEMVINNYHRPEVEYKPQWTRATRLLGTVFLIISLLVMLLFLRPVLQMLVMSFLIAFLIYNPINFMRKRMKFPWVLSVAIGYLILFIILFLIIIIVIPNVIRGINGIIEQIVILYNTLDESMRSYQYDDGVFNLLGFKVDMNPIMQPIIRLVLGEEAPESVQDPNSVLPETLPGSIGDQESDQSPYINPTDFQGLLLNVFGVVGSLTSFFTEAVTNIAGFVAAIAMSLFISFLLLLEVPSDADWINHWVPKPYIREMSLLLEQVLEMWNGFFKGQLVIGIIIGALSYIQFRLMGVSYPEILAIIAGIISLIPTIGGFLALIPVLIVTFTTGSAVWTNMGYFPFTILVLIVNILISQVIWNLIAPKILGDYLNLPLPVIIVGVFIGAAFGGILGAFLVAPLMGTLRVVYGYIVSKISMEDPFKDYLKKKSDEEKAKLERQVRRIRAS